MAPSMVGANGMPSPRRSARPCSSVFAEVVIGVDRRFIPVEPSGAGFGADDEEAEDDRGEQRGDERERRRYLARHSAGTVPAAVAT